ncbi:MAG TPA: hypothetical protein VFB72_20200, partial [Verrucomicrobiae bacterium]|nr:hypothetical protein [Verrucomicrobiae bacterium]
MKKFAHYARFCPALVALFIMAAGTTFASDLPIRQADEDVNSAAVRERASLRPNTNLLFNGW